MDKNIQFSINRNMLIAVSIIILLLAIAAFARGGRGHDMRMMKGGYVEKGPKMMQRGMEGKMPAGTPVEEEQRLMRPPTEQEIASGTIDLQ